MVYISIDELLPLAHRYGKEHTVLIGIIFGMIVMALSLILLARA
jgi:ZIP family zinc transporter